MSTRLSTRSWFLRIILPRMPRPNVQDRFYAVKRGYVPGVYRTWEQCEAQVKGFIGAQFKKFTSIDEAERFVNLSLENPVLPAPTLAKSSSPETTPEGRKRRRLSNEGDDYAQDIVYCDGSCKGNGQVGSLAGIGVWWKQDDPRNLAERCPGNQTNNRAELIAIVRALETAPIHSRPLTIKTDSKYAIQCIEDWLPAWSGNGWRTAKGDPVKNLGIIRYIDACLAHRRAHGQLVSFAHVPGHSGIPGNEAADALANQGATMPALEERDWDALRHTLELGRDQGQPPAISGGGEQNMSVSHVQQEGPRGKKRAYEVDFGAGTMVEAVSIEGSTLRVRVASSHTPAKVEVTAKTRPPAVDPPDVAVTVVNANHVDFSIYEDDLLDDEQLAKLVMDGEL